MTVNQESVTAVQRYNTGLVLGQDERLPSPTEDSNLVLGLVFEKENNHNPVLNYDLPSGDLNHPVRTQDSPGETGRHL